MAGQIEIKTFNNLIVFASPIGTSPTPRRRCMVYGVHFLNASFIKRNISMLCHAVYVVYAFYAVTLTLCLPFQLIFFNRTRMDWTCIWKCSSSNSYHHTIGYRNFTQFSCYAMLGNDLGAKKAHSSFLTLSNSSTPNQLSFPFSFPLCAVNSVLCPILALSVQRSCYLLPKFEIHCHRKQLLFCQNIIFYMWYSTCTLSGIVTSQNETRKGKRNENYVIYVIVSRSK